MGIERCLATKWRKIHASRPASDYYSPAGIAAAASRDELPCDSPGWEHNSSNSPSHPLKAMPNPSNGKSWFKWLQFFAAMAAFAFSLIMARGAWAITSPYYGLIVMSAVLGVGTFGRQLFQLKMPFGLRALHAWEKHGLVYRNTGVIRFGVILRRTPLRYLQPLVYFHGQPGEMAAVLAQAEGAEATHFWAALALTPYVVFAGMRHQWGAVLGLMILQLLMNLYPLCHLRWVRHRLDMVQSKKDPRQPKRRPV
jgi:hypothetical protein